MNARQRRRHTRAVRLKLPTATRRYVTFALARRDRLQCRGRRYYPGSRAGLRNARLRKALAEHPDVRRWKSSQWLGQYTGTGQYAATVESLTQAVEAPGETPLLFPDVTPAEVKAVAERWKTSGLSGPWYCDASKRPDLVPLTPNWHQHRTVTGRVGPKEVPPPHDLPPTPTRLWDVGLAAADVAAMEREFLDGLDDEPAPQGPTFPAALDTPRPEGLVAGEVATQWRGRGETITGRFSGTRRDPPIRNIPFPRNVVVGNDAEHNLVVESSTLAADIRAAATVSVDVPERSAIDAEEIPQAARADVYVHIDFVPDFVPVPEKE